MNKTPKAYFLALFLCIGLSGFTIIMTAPQTQAKSLLDELGDALAPVLNGKPAQKTTPADNQTKTADSKSATQQKTPVTTQTQSQPSAASTTSNTVSTAAIPVTKAQTTQVTATIPDTSLQVKQVATAQAIRSNTPTTYTSSKIPESQRDLLYKISIASGSFGALLYMFSFIKARQWMYKNTIAAPKVVTQ